MSEPVTKELIEDIIEPFMDSVRKELSRPTNSERVYPLYLILKKLNKALGDGNIKGNIKRH